MARQSGGDAIRFPWSDIDTTKPAMRYLACAGVDETPLRFPKSQYEGWSPPHPYVEESTIIVQALSAITASEKSPWTMIDVVEFCFYRPLDCKIRAGELTTLDTLSTIGGSDELCMDAVVIVKSRRQFLTGVRICTLALDGYGDTTSAAMDDRLSVQSVLAGKHEIWYRLGKPCAEYMRYYQPMLWISGLAKFFVEFLLHGDAKHVTLDHFRVHFGAWITKTYKSSARKWLSEYGRTDFRHAVVGHINFLWKEMHGVEPKLRHAPLWSECGPKLSAIQAVGSADMPTIVTPFVHGIFKDMYFRKMLQVTSPASPMHTKQLETRRCRLGLTSWRSQAAPSPKLMSSKVKSVAAGCVVLLKPDARTVWTGGDLYWLAYVQRVRIWKDGTTKLDLIWLYRAADTTLRGGSYPFQNELFMSDACACGREAYDLEEVMGIASIQWYARDMASIRHNAFGVRQTYLTNAHEFVSLQSRHFACNCKGPGMSEMAEAMRDFKVNDFVLVRHGQYSGEVWQEHDVLEAVQIRQFMPANGTISVRPLLRAGRDSGKVGASINELVWSEQTLVLKPYHLVRKCTVTGFPSLAAVAPLYHRHGAGDLFFYLYKGGDPAAPQSTTTPSPRSKLHGMGICCGGGSYDRGLEDSGVVEFEHVIDFNEVAIHSYRANTTEKEKVNFFLGPMERYLQDALLEHKTGYTIALPGDIDVLAAGSPCPGFSHLQPDKLSEGAMKQASLLAGTLAFVDYFMPLWVLLENVIGIGTVVKGQDESQNVLCQTLCCLVGLGYQVKQIIIDAPQTGSFQSRGRVFILATAPGLTPLERPPQTHLSRKRGVRSRSVGGKMANGRKQIDTADDLAPFPMVTFDDGTRDLPNVGDGHVRRCIAYPDHQPGEKQMSMMQDMIGMVPKIPFGLGIAQANAMDRIAEPQRSRWLVGKTIRCAPGSRSCMRVRPNWIMNAVTTFPQTLDAFVGTCLHPHHHRLLTVMEVRRAQGFPDDEVIIGSVAQQWRIIGNSVHRNVAYALGLSLKDAIDKSADALGRLQTGRVPNDGMVRLEMPLQQSTPGTSSLHASLKRGAESDHDLMTELDLGLKKQRLANVDGERDLDQSRSGMVKSQELQAVAALTLPPLGLWEESAGISGPDTKQTAVSASELSPPASTEAGGEALHQRRTLRTTTTQTTVITMTTKTVETVTQMKTSRTSIGKARSLRVD